MLVKIWRRRRELNPGKGICSPSPVPLGYGAPIFRYVDFNMPVLNCKDLTL